MFPESSSFFLNVVHALFFYVSKQKCAQLYDAEISKTNFLEILSAKDKYDKIYVATSFDVDTSS